MFTARRVMALTTVLLVGATLGRADDVEAVQKKIDAAWQKLQSLSAKQTIVSQMGIPGEKMETRGEGTLEFMKQGDKLLLRNENKTTTITEQGGEQKKFEMSTLTVSDGEYTYSLTDQGGQKMAVKSKADAARTFAPQSVLKTMGLQYEFKLLPEDKLDGRKVYTLEGAPREKEHEGLGKVVLTFDAETGALVKQTQKGADDKPVMTITFTDLKVDTKIDPERFKFKVPEGVQVIDQATGAPAATVPSTKPSKP